MNSWLGFGFWFLTEVSARRSLDSSTGSDRGSLANPLCYGFLTPRPVLGAPVGPIPYTTVSPLRPLCGTRWVRTLVLQESRSFVIKASMHLVYRCNPATAGRGHFEMHCFPQQRNDPTSCLVVTSAKNANQCDPRASADAESARNDLPRAPCPQDILKVRPPNSLDYRARYKPQPVVMDRSINEQTDMLVEVAL